MGKRGPAPKPRHLKLLEGTYRPDREAPDAPDPEPGAPNRPAWLGKEVPWGPLAVAVWRYYEGRLEGLRLLTEVDREKFAAFCDAAGRWQYFRKLVATEGHTQTTPNGYQASSAVMNHMNKALDDMNRFGALFGLSPSERTRVSAVAEKQTAANPFAELGRGA